MNINPLFEKQAELDEYIGKSKGIDMADKKPERIIALQVEFGELVNELRFLFKYWSEKEWNREDALEEYSDGLHFILSVGNDMGVKKHTYEPPEVNDMRALVIGIGNMISRLVTQDNKVYEELVNHYILLGDKLGFTDDDILTHYELKHAENYARQQRSY